jgi:hypothetical protein
MENKDYLDGWVTTYNSHMKLYLSTTRDNYNKLFSNSKDISVLKSSSIHSLEALIIEGKGELSNILKIMDTWK